MQSSRWRCHGQLTLPQIPQMVLAGGLLFILVERAYNCRRHQKLCQSRRTPFLRLVDLHKSPQTRGGELVPKGMLLRNRNTSHPITTITTAYSGGLQKSSGCGRWKILWFEMQYGRQAIVVQPLTSSTPGATRCNPGPSRNFVPGNSSFSMSDTL